MTKKNRSFLLGVLFGFIGIGMYALILRGFDNVYFKDVVEVIKNLLPAFIFTEILTAIGVEGVSNLKKEFKEFKEKHSKKSKETETLF